MNIIKRIRIWIRVLDAYIRTYKGIECHILDADKTVDEIIAGKSLIRFGDGEFGIYEGRDIHYQPWTPELRHEFEAIKSTFEKEGSDCRYLLALPKKYMQCPGQELGKKRVLISSWAEARLYFKKNFCRTLTYGDSFLFQKKNRDNYSRIWLHPGDNRVIIFVHNNHSFAEYFHRTYQREVIYVPCTSHDAFSMWQRLISDIEMKISDRALHQQDVQVVLSAGPAGKVIAYHLSQKGYHCIDAGHCWDDPLES